jgi:hypothetical protein
MVGNQPGADLKERLAVPVGQLVEDDSPRGVGQGLEDVTHTHHHRQADTCMSSGAARHRTAAELAQTAAQREAVLGASHADIQSAQEWRDAALRELDRSEQ